MDINGQKWTNNGQLMDIGHELAHEHGIVLYYHHSSFSSRNKNYNLIFNFGIIVIYLQIKTLKELDLRGCELITDAGLPNLYPLVNLKTLFLPYNEKLPYRLESDLIKVKISKKAVLALGTKFPPYPRFKLMPDSDYYN